MKHTLDDQIEDIAACNLTLLSAMAKLKANPCKHTKDVLFEELNNAIYILAASLDGDRDDEVTVLNTSDGAGHTFLPVFTDKEQLKLYIKVPVKTFILKAKDLWDWIISVGGYQGVVINPAKDSLPLSLPQLEYLQTKNNGERPDFESV